jgi:hypothetical protein
METYFQLVDALIVTDSVGALISAKPFPYSSSESFLLCSNVVDSYMSDCLSSASLFHSPTPGSLHEPDKKHE